MACQTKEVLVGTVIASAAATGIGTAINVAALFPAAAVQKLNEITVFNDADRPVKVEWTNDLSGRTDYFVVPNGGKNFIRRLNAGNIVPASLKVSSVDATTATGNICINLAAN